MKDQALMKMKQIVEGIYDSTPGISDEIPKGTSKILATVKKSNQRAEMKMREDKRVFEANNPNDRNPQQTSLTYTAEDWVSKYQIVKEQYLEEKKKTDFYKNHLVNKQKRYINREVEYRETIKLLEK